VEAVERAAVDFLVERLDAGNVLSALALGEHLSVGEIGRDLQEKSRDWLNKNFGLVGSEPAFLRLAVGEVVSLVESDELEVMEEDVFGAVMSWVKEDEVARKEALGRLLPLVRFPMMKKALLLMTAEPLVAQHPLAFQLVSETHQAFVESAGAASYPRRQPRKGQRLGGARLAGSPAFTLASATHYDFSAEDGTMLRACGLSRNRAVVCAGHVMRTGRHAVEVTAVQGSIDIFLGLARPNIDVHEPDSEDNDGFWCIRSDDGVGAYDGQYAEWEGQEGFEQGDVVGLLLNCDAGTLTVKKNGVRLGVVFTGLTGELCWAASLFSTDDSVRIGAADAAAAGW
jgi:hypothetical protein